MKIKLSVAFVLVLFLWAEVAYSGNLTGKVTVQGESNSSDVVVYVEGVRGDFSLPPVSPEMNHVNLRFQPMVLAVLKGTTVLFPNSDPVFHSAFSVSASNPFDLGIYGKGREKSVRFENTGIVEIFCRIHSHMHSMILVLDNPYFTMTDREGEYRIRNIPEGTYTVYAWKNLNAMVNQTGRILKGNTTGLDFTLNP
jgi:plastocyanin